MHRVYIVPSFMCFKLTSVQLVKTDDMFQTLESFRESFKPGTITYSVVYRSICIPDIQVINMFIFKMETFSVNWMSGCAETSNSKLHIISVFVILKVICSSPKFTLLILITDVIKLSEF